MKLKAKTIFFVMCLWSLSASAKLTDATEFTANEVVEEQEPAALSAEVVNEKELDESEPMDELVITTSEDELKDALSSLDEEDGEVVYVDDEGDEYVIVPEQYAQEGVITVKLKKKSGGKGRNCVATDGGASWYGPGFNGRRTANGERFNQSALTAAHKTIKFNSLVRVTYRGRSVVVRINDAGPFVRGRVIDLSKAAAQEIGLIAAGHGQVNLEILRCGSGE